jgi:uncharacterized protein YcfJ
VKAGDDPILNWEHIMRKTLLAVATLAAIAIAPTGANAQGNTVGGALLGAGTGAVIGGAVGGGRGAAVGAGVGAVTGAAIGAQADGRYYYGGRYYTHRECWRNANGRLRCRYY